VDVMIDDSYEHVLHATIPPLLEEAEFYSFKDHTMGVKPFLHSTEGRVFSHSLAPPTKTGCTCAVCLLCHQMTRSYGQYLQLKLWVVMCGGGRCLETEIHEEVTVKAIVFKEIQSHPTYVLETPAQKRSAIALAAQGEISRVSAYEIKKGKDVTPQDYIHGQGFIGQDRGVVCEDLRGEMVAFKGVSPLEIGDTPIFSPSNHHSATASLETRGHLFVHEKAVMHNISVRYLWVDSVREIPGYAKTGRQWKQWRQYERNNYDVHEVDLGVRWSLVVGEELDVSDVPWARKIGGEYRLGLLDYMKQPIGECLPPYPAIDGDHTKGEGFFWNLSSNRGKSVEGYMIYDSTVWTADVFRVEEVKDPDVGPWTLNMWLERSGAVVLSNFHLGCCSYEVRGKRVEFSRCVHRKVLRRIVAGVFYFYLQPYRDKKT